MINLCVLAVVLPLVWWCIKDAGKDENFTREVENNICPSCGSEMYKWNHYSDIGATFHKQTRSCRKCGLMQKRIF